jgi:hypothetical protein
MLDDWLQQPEPDSYLGRIWSKLKAKMKFFDDDLKADKFLHSYETGMCYPTQNLGV